MADLGKVQLPNGATYEFRDSGALRADAAAAVFSPQTSYSQGDVCTYEGKVFRANRSHLGAWAPLHFDEVNPIQEQLDALVSAIASIPDPSASVNSCRAAITALLNAVRALA